MLEASEQAHFHLQDPVNCPDEALRQVFHDMKFGDLDSIQKAILEIPKSLDMHGKLEGLLLVLFQRDVPNLSPKQHKEGARLYAYALLSAAGTLEDFTLPIVRNFVIENSKKLDLLGVGQAEIKSLLERLVKGQVVSFVPSPTLPGDLPHGSHLPFPKNDNFTGRTADLEKLSVSLLSNDQPGVVVNQTILGMGGIGKTQLAVEFAYKHGHHFKGVHWLDLKEADDLDQQIALCGEKMGLPAWPPTLPEQVTVTLREWLGNNPRLLILDNFEALEAANEVLARLRHSGLRLLITSRRTDWNTALGLKRLPLDEFSPQESLMFLRKYISEERESDEDLAKLAEHLGRLPLALELAGRFLEKQPRLKIEAYLSQLENALDHRSMQNWKAEIKSLTGHDLSLLQTFARSWELVTDETTQKLFITAGYCAPNTLIPDQILEAALGDQNEALDECLSDLYGLGLLKHGPTIHPLLAQFARTLDEEQIVVTPFSDAFAELANQTNHEVDRTGDYSLYTALLPHVRAMAELAGSASLNSAGKLWNSLGYHISDIADYSGAKAAYERALKIFEKQLGEDHPNVATLVNNLGSVLKALGDHAGAKAAYERALRIFKMYFPPEHPNVRTVRGNLENL